MAMMTLEAQRWLALNHPFWNRSQGADHIWLFSHDEGACWAPTDVRGGGAGTRLLAAPLRSACTGPLESWHPSAGFAVPPAVLTIAHMKFAGHE
jgi:hypothetical protein